MICNAENQQWLITPTLKVALKQTVPKDEYDLNHIKREIIPELIIFASLLVKKAEEILLRWNKLTNMVGFPCKLSNHLASSKTGGFQRKILNPEHLLEEN